MNNSPTVRIIGLTGSIATGKSTIARHLSTVYQLPVFDADVYAREAVETGSEILDRIRQRYGETIQLPDGSLDRRSLGAIVFANPDERQWLEQQIHPYVRQRFIEAIEQHKSSTKPIVLVIPLLFEAEMEDLVCEVWVVYCSTTQQIERLMQRDRLTREQARVRMDAQMPLDAKCALADRVLDNSSTRDFWMKQVESALV
ncbi:MAG: dephospho-CoA kinase [Geitlerinemataceae cyanobacterium]